MNARVRKNVATDTAVLAIADAKQAGAIAFFGEKYGDTVRVVTMGESKEFCGGTHVARTGDIAFFKLTEETGVAQGVRRIEATTGAGAARLRPQDGGRAAGVGAPAARRRVRGRRAHHQAAGRPAGAGKGAREAAPQARLRRRTRPRRRGARRQRRARAGDRAPTSPIRRRCARSPISCATSSARASIVLAGVEGDKIALVAMVSPDLVGKHHAGKIVGEVAKAVGRQGGRPARHGAGGRLRSGRARRGAGEGVRSRPWLKSAPRRPSSSTRPTPVSRWRRRCAGASPGESWSDVRALCTTGKVSLDGERALDPAARVRAGPADRDRSRTRPSRTPSPPASASPSRTPTSW